MKYGRVIEQAVRSAQDVLWAALPPLSDTETIRRIRGIVGVPGVHEALERGSDTVAAFALRGMHRVLSDGPELPRATINRLCDILNDPDLGRALGVSPNSRLNLWLKKPPAR